MSTNPKASKASQVNSSLVAQEVVLIVALSFESSLWAMMGSFPSSVAVPFPSVSPVMTAFSPSQNVWPSHLTRMAVSPLKFPAVPPAVPLRASTAALVALPLDTLSPVPPFELTETPVAPFVLETTPAPPPVLIEKTPNAAPPLVVAWKPSPTAFAVVAWNASFESAPAVERMPTAPEAATFESTPRVPPVALTPVLAFPSKKPAAPVPAEAALFWALMPNALAFAVLASTPLFWTPPKLAAAPVPWLAEFCTAFTATALGFEAVAKTPLPDPVAFARIAAPVLAPARLTWNPFPEDWMVFRVVCLVADVARPALMASPLAPTATPDHTTTVTAVSAMTRRVVVNRMKPPLPGCPGPHSIRGGRCITPSSRAPARGCADSRGNQEGRSKATGPPPDARASSTGTAWMAGGAARMWPER
jgi:hypothetical protein